MCAARAGFQITGQLWPSGNWREVSALPEQRVAALWGNRSTANKYIIERARRSVVSDEDVVQAFDSKIEEEVASGRAVWLDIGA